MVEFEDFVVKLLVIDELMQTGDITPPHDNGYKWLAAARGISPGEADRLAHSEELFAKRVPEIEGWAQELEITQEQLDSVESLYWDGGNAIFMLMAPSWDGEDELFDAETYVDVTPARFPALKQLTYSGKIEDEVVEALEAAGVEVEEF